MWCVFELSHHVVLALRAARDPARTKLASATLIRHAGQCSSTPVRSLTVSVIQSSFRALLMSAIGIDDVAYGALCYDSDNCSTAVLGHSSDRSRKAPRSRQLGKILDER